MNAYESYIQSCKAPKGQEKIKRIVHWIIVGIRKGYTTNIIAEKLNIHNILTIQGKQWTYHALQMQLLKISRLDSDSSLAWAFSVMLNDGNANEADLLLIQERTRKSNSKAPMITMS